MPRDHARVKLSIWEDDDFLELSPAAQHLYFVLLTSPELTYAGVTDWRPNRIAKRASAWTAQAVEIAAQELSKQLFVLVDPDTEEVLLRTLIRHDGLLEQPNLAVAVRKAWTSTASPLLRGVIVHELHLLRTGKPDLKGWPKIIELLGRPAIDPTSIPSFHPSRDPSDDPSGNPPIDPSRKGSDDPSDDSSIGGDANPSDDPSGKGSPITAPNSNSLSQLHNSGTSEESSSRERHEPARARPGTDPPPRCATHPNGDSDEPCAGCARVRQWRDRNEQAAREAAARAREQCPDCHGTGWREKPDGNPAGKCDHRRTA